MSASVNSLIIVEIVSFVFGALRQTSDTNSVEDMVKILCGIVQGVETVYYARYFRLANFDSRARNPVMNCICSSSLFHSNGDIGIFGDYDEDVWYFFCLGLSGLVLS